ncbi:MAG: outer rane adhesin like protein [Planctomycetaceae bacterium]|nr:outer rane adhesin like protein [Planctomycetaceae bacterium]
MPDCSWSRWLHLAVRNYFAVAPRKIRTASILHVEGLEERSLLTTFVPLITNNAPVATPASAVTPEDKPLNGQLTGADLDADPLTFKAGSLLPTHGTLTVNLDGTFTYIPAINFHGTDSFSFVANDGTVDSAPATVNITVTSVNDPPTVVDGSASPSEDVAYVDSLTSLASDADGDTLTYAVVTAPSHGTVTITSAGTFTYTPSANYNGPDSFTFKANDSHADSNVGTFNLTVTPVDDPLTLAFPTEALTYPNAATQTPKPTTQVARNSASVRIDPAATLRDVDTVVNYSGTTIRTTIFSGNSNGDNTKNRVFLTLQSQGQGPGLVYVKGSHFYYDGSTVPAGSVTGGTSGHALLIAFRAGATESMVNAVLKQIAVQASKKAIAGDRGLNMTILAGGQQVFGAPVVTVI